MEEMNQSTVSPSMKSCCLLKIKTGTAAFDETDESLIVRDVGCERL